MKKPSLLTRIKWSLFEKEILKPQGSTKISPDVLLYFGACPKGVQLFTHMFGSMGVTMEVIERRMDMKSCFPYDENPNLAYDRVDYALWIITMLPFVTEDERRSVLSILDRYIPAKQLAYMVELYKWRVKLRVPKRQRYLFAKYHTLFKENHPDEPV